LQVPPRALPSLAPNPPFERRLYPLKIDRIGKANQLVAIGTLSAIDVVCPVSLIYRGGRHKSADNDLLHGKKRSGKKKSASPAFFAGDADSRFSGSDRRDHPVN
jgi:hypothetical protein